MYHNLFKMQLLIVAYGAIVKITYIFETYQ